MSAPPDHCPDCNCELYPVAHLRPRLTFTPTAKLLIAFGIVLGAVLYSGGLLYVRSMYWVPVRGLALAGFPVAVLPALACAWLAYLLPRRMTMHCRRCGWSAQFTSGRQPAPKELDDAVPRQAPAPLPPINHDEEMVERSAVTERLERVRARQRQQAKRAEADQPPNPDFDFRK